MDSMTGRLTALVLVVLLPAGFLLTRFLGRRMGDFRREHLFEINQVLRELASTAGGQYADGALLTNHPLLGELHRYGTARLAAGALPIEVGVSYPGGDRSDDHTTVRVTAPRNRRWRIDAVASAPAVQRDQRSGGHRRRDRPLLRDRGRIVARDCRPRRAQRWCASARARSRWIYARARSSWSPPPMPGTVYVAPVARLHTLVEQTAEAAEALLTPGAP